MPLEGKVAELLTTRELVINLGTDHGVKPGMKFVVLPEKAVEIVDPDTDEPLGVIEREKVRVQASEVYSRFTICKTYRTRTIPGQGFAFGMGGLFGEYTPSRTVYETLKQDDAASPLPPISPSESYVQIGDRVRQLEDTRASDESATKSE